MHRHSALHTAISYVQPQGDVEPQGVGAIIGRVNLHEFSHFVDVEGEHPLPDLEDRGSADVVDVGGAVVGAASRCRREGRRQPAEEEPCQGIGVDSGDLVGDVCTSSPYCQPHRSTPTRLGMQGFSSPCVLSVAAPTQHGGTTTTANDRGS